MGIKCIIPKREIVYGKDDIVQYTILPKKEWVRNTAKSLGFKPTNQFILTQNN